jgi:DNA-directed RNA polymerase subunit beta
MKNSLNSSDATTLTLPVSHTLKVKSKLSTLRNLDNYGVLPLPQKGTSEPTVSLTQNIENGDLTKKTVKIVSTEYSLETFQRSNQDTSLTHKPAVFENMWVQSGDLLTDCASSVGGELSLGQNLLIAYMPWEGYNFEDAILISERLVRDDLYTSVHIERYDIETSETKLGVEQITRDIPDISEKEIQHLDSFGIIKMGSWVEEGDILVGKVTPINKKTISPYQKLLYTILEKQIRPIRDSSLRAPKGIKAKVIDIKYFLRQNPSFLSMSLSPSGGDMHEGIEVTGRKKSKMPKKVEFTKGEGKTPCLKQINKIFYKQMTKKDKLNLLRFYLFSRFEFQKSLKHNFIKNNRKLKSSDLKRFQMLLQSSKMNNFGHKSSETNRLMRFTVDSRTSSMVKSKANKTKETEKNLILRNIETIHIYLAEKRKIQVGDKMAGRHGNKGIVSQILPITDMPYLPDGTPLDMVLNPLGVPSRMNVGQIYECLLGLAGRFLGENYKVFSFDEIYGPDASRSFVFNKLYQARSQTGFKWLFDPNSPGKMRLYDGRTGDSFEQKVTVGQAYILRLVHMVDDKIHMRSTGPYSLVTQQPLRGRSKQGGQRLGEMEVWAIEGYGAAFTLLEMLTIKSDDMTGRMTLWSNLILNKDISIGTPESFKVLICELQALCLDIGLFRYMNTNNTTTSLKEITSLVNLP